VTRDIAHTFERLEYLKLDPRFPDVGGTYEVILRGGETESPTEILRSRLADIDELIPNETYVILLCSLRCTKS